MSNETQNETSVNSDDNRLVAERRAKLDAIREQGVAFPNTFRRDAYAADLQEQFGDLERNIRPQVCGQAGDFQGSGFSFCDYQKAVYRSARFFSEFALFLVNH